MLIPDERVLVAALAALVMLVAGALLVRRARRPRAPAGSAASDGAPLSVAGWVDERLARVITLIEAVRKGDRPAAELVPFLAQTIDALAEEARAVREAPVPPPGHDGRDAAVAGIVRASRLVEQALDACLTLEGSTRPESHDRAQRDLKWTHANLVAAREALVAGPERAEEQSGARPVSSVG